MPQRVRGAMKVTTVRFGGDLWRLLEAEAAAAGVSASQYIREAALARAAAAAAMRGEDPIALLAGSADPPDRESSPKDAARNTRTEAASLRKKAAETQTEVAATTAQSRQAIHHAQQLTRDSRANRPKPERPR